MIQTLIKLLQPEQQPNSEQTADNISVSPSIANAVLSESFLQSLDWWQLYKVAEPLVANITDKRLHEKILEIFPLEKGQEYVGSLCNHYRGRLKHEGKFALLDQLCKNSMKRLIVGLS
jgi:hypothetical protein